MKFLSTVVRKSVLIVLLGFILVLFSCKTHKKDFSTQNDNILAPLYWSVYEYCYTTDGFIPEEEWEANINWIEDNFKEYGYNTICIDGWDKNLGVLGRTDRPIEHYQTALRWMREACDEHGVFLSLVMPHLKNHGENELEYAGGSMIRINEDTGNGGWQRFSEMDRGTHHDWWSQYYNAFDGFIYWSDISGSGDRQMILDGDFIRLNTFENDDERKTVVSLMLMAGGCVTIADRYSTIGDSAWIYQNTELLALQSDGFTGKPFSNDPLNTESQKWKGQMSNGDFVVGLFNREDEAETRSINFSTDLGITGNSAVRDLWEHEDLGVMTSYSINLEPHSCVILKIVPADDVDSQTSERSGTNKLVPFPSESRDRKETYPAPWGGIEPPKRFWVQGLPWGMIPFIVKLVAL